MSESAKNEERWLSAAEREAVARTHFPAIRELSADELVQSKTLLGELRDRARASSLRQREATRGRGGAPGRSPAAEDTGARRKLSVLAGAAKRLGSEMRRRRDRANKEELVALSRSTLSRKRTSALSQKAPQAQPAPEAAPRVEAESPPAPAVADPS